jgi:3-hydroxyisobutyrate dehydrogenase-like beta-hydroxyacid dehydrogenase
VRGRGHASTAELRHIAVLGLGEAGSALARDLVAARVRVCGFDPVGFELEGVETAADAVDAARGADAVLSVNSAEASPAAARSVAAELSGGALFADLNTAAPGVKKSVAAVVEVAGGEFADVALIGPVPGNGLRTPALVSGPGAGRFVQLLGGLGMPVTVVGTEPGDAAARKLARSVFAKGLAASVGEALAAAERLGCEEWLAGELERTLTEADAALLRRLLEGSRRHAARREEEMTAAIAMLDELEVPARIATAAQQWLRSLVAQDGGGQRQTEGGER